MTELNKFSKSVSRSWVTWITCCPGGGRPGFWFILAEPKTTGYKKPEEVHRFSRFTLITRGGLKKEKKKKKGSEQSGDTRHGEALERRECERSPEVEEHCDVTP